MTMEASLRRAMVIVVSILLNGLLPAPLPMPSGQQYGDRSAASKGESLMRAPQGCYRMLYTL